MGKTVVPTVHLYDPHRCRAKSELLYKFKRLLPESQDQNLALTVLHVPCSLDSGPKMTRA